MTPITPDLLECLAAIVEEGGFEKAAKRLSITQSAVSQRLRTLETQTGTVLIVRGRPLKPTPAGRLLLKHTMQMRLLHTDLEHDLRKLSPSTTGTTQTEDRVSIAVNADSIATWALPAFAGLIKSGLPLEISFSGEEGSPPSRAGRILWVLMAVPLRPWLIARPEVTSRL